MALVLAQFAFPILAGYGITGLLKLRKENDLSEQFIQEFYKAIHLESINQQTKILNKNEKTQRNS